MTFAASSIVLIATCFLLLVQSILTSDDNRYTLGRIRRTYSSKSEDLDYWSSSESDDEDDGTIDRTYGVIVDCGSSGTRANIFVWNSKLGFPMLLNHIEPLRDSNRKPVTKKVTPGLSSFADNPNGADEYMKQIIEFISEQIPEEWHSSTSIYIMATAGMRLLEEEIQMKIMNEVTEHLNNDKHFAKARTSIISGTEEGMYQWITVNSKSKRFMDKKMSRRPPEHPTIGIIEMGGASLQVAYQITDGLDFKMFDDLARVDHAAAVAFEGSLKEPEMNRESQTYAYKLFSTSFLGFGSKSAREAYVDLLISNDGNLFKKVVGSFQSFVHNRFYPKKNHDFISSVKLKDPCLPKGTKQSVERPRRMLRSGKHTIGHIIEEGDLKFTAILEGSGDYKSCRRLVKLLLDTAKSEEMNCNGDESCPMKLLGTPFVPFDQFKFVGLADFYYTTNIMMGLAGTYDHALITKRTKMVCETSYEDLLVNYPEVVDTDRLTQECFKAVFVDTFLIEGLQMPKNHSNFETIGHIQGDALEWTLGAVIDKAASIHAAS